jgi:hypothetical protein
MIVSIIKNGQSRIIGNIGHKKTETKKTTTIESNTDTTKKRDEPKVHMKGMYYRN